MPHDLDLSELLDGDLEAVDDDTITATLVGLEGLETRLQAARLRVQSEWDRRQLWALDGCVTGGQWLASRCAMAGSTARERLRIAAKLRSLPVVFAALADGTITYAKARALAGVYRPATADAFARDETMLAGIARNLSVDDLVIALREWAARADPDGTDQSIERTERDRRANLSQTLDGTARLDANLTAEATAIIAPALASIADDLRRAETDAAASPLTATQRRHDALVETARRATAAPPGSSPATPLFVINIDHQTLTAHHIIHWAAQGPTDLDNLILLCSHHHHL